MNCLEKAGKKLLSQIIVIEQFGWPPSCIGLVYQPERPVCHPAADEKAPEENGHK